jgi:hypothetical protein
VVRHRARRFPETRMSCHLAPTFAMNAGTTGSVAMHDSNDALIHGLVAECHSGYIIASS